MPKKAAAGDFYFKSKILVLRRKLPNKSPNRIFDMILKMNFYLFAEKKWRFHSFLEISTRYRVIADCFYNFYKASFVCFSYEFPVPKLLYQNQVRKQL